MASIEIGRPGGGRDDVAEQDGGGLGVHLALVDGGEGDDPGESPFQLADVLLDLVGDEGQDVLRDVAAGGAQLRLEDRQAGLEVGRLDVGDQAPLEPGAEAVLERRDLLGRPVGRDDDLLVDLVEGVEGVEELLLGAVLAGQELDVVDEQHVDSPVLVPELAHLGGLDGGDNLVGEFSRW